MPRLDHRKMEKLFFSSDLAPVFQGVGGTTARRRHRNLKLALGVQMVFSTYNMLFAVFEMTSMDSSPVHSRPPAELFKVMAYSSSCFVAYRSVSAYLRLMLIWTLTTAFNGVYQPLLWLKSVGGSSMEQYLVWMLLVLSVAGMAGNIFGAMTVFTSQPPTVRRRRRGWGSGGPTKES